MSAQRYTFRVPAFAARHRGQLVAAAIEVAQKAFLDRFELRRPAHDRWGNVIREPLDMFLMRPRPRPPTRKDGAAWRSAAELEGRRADHLQTLLALWVTTVAVADHETWSLHEPTHELAQKHPYPSMLRLAELADLVPENHGLDDAPDGVWRARAELEKSGMISFTKELRPKRDGHTCRRGHPCAPGSHYSAGGAFRRLGRKVLAAIGGKFGRAILDQWAETKRLRAQRAQEAKAFKDQVDALWAEEARAAAAAGGPAAPAEISSPEDVEIDRVHDENPSWPFSRILAEARRRLAELARAGPDTADNTS